MSKKVLILITTSTIRIHEGTICTTQQEVFYLAQTLHIIVSIIITGTYTEFKLLCLHCIVQAQFLTSGQAIVSSPLWTTSTSETSITYIVGSTYKRKLTTLVSMTGKTINIGTSRIAFFCSNTTIDISDPTLIHSFLHFQVEHSFFFTIVNTSNTGIVRLSIVSIDFINHIDRQVLQTSLHITAKEFLSINKKLFHFLTIDFHITVIIHFSTRNLLDQFFQHGTF